MTKKGLDFLMAETVAQRRTRRHTFVMLTVETLEACDGDANLAVIADYIRWRSDAYDIDRARTTPSDSLWLGEDGRVWVRCTTHEAAEAVVQSSRSMERRLTKLVEMGVLDRRQDIGHWSDRAYWYTRSAERDYANRVGERVRGNCADRVDVPVVVRPKEEENTYALPYADCGSDTAAPPAVVDRPKSIDEHFESWWQAYPRHVGKKAARRSYEQAVKKGEATHGELLAGALRYRDDPGRSEKYTKHPTTWLNQGCWSDSPTPVTSVTDRQRAINDKVRAKLAAKGIR